MKLGFIGTGNMAGAIIGGVIKSNVFNFMESMLLIAIKK